MPLWREAHFEVKFKTDGLGPLLEVEMSKKCTPLWREGSQKWKIEGFGAFLDVWTSFRVAGARDSAPGQKRWQACDI